MNTDSVSNGWAELSMIRRAGHFFSGLVLILHFYSQAVHTPQGWLDGMGLGGQTFSVVTHSNITRRESNLSLAP